MKAVDVVQAKVDMINQHKSPIVDKEIEEYLAEKNLNLVANIGAQEAYKDADYVVIATPTNYDSVKKFFDMSSVEAVIEIVRSVNLDAVIVVKSTVLVGYTE